MPRLRHADAIRESKTPPQKLRWRRAVPRTSGANDQSVREQIVETIISVNGEKRLGPMSWGFVSRPPRTQDGPING
jgi:hypothetical protein